MKTKQLGIQFGIKVGMAALALALGSAGCVGAPDAGSQAQADDAPSETAKLVHSIDAGNGHTFEFFDLGAGQVGVKEQYVVGDKPLLEASAHQTLTLADMYQRVASGAVPPEILAADAHAADTLSKPELIRKEMERAAGAPATVPSAAVPSSVEAVKSAATSSCSADLFGDQWSAQWFVDNFAQLWDYTCGGDFVNVNHGENLASSQFWAGGKYTWLYKQFEGDFNVAGSLYIYRNGFGLPANIPFWSGAVPPRNVVAWTIKGGLNSQTNHADGKSPCGHDGAAQIWCGLL